MVCTHAARIRTRSGSDRDALALALEGDRAFERILALEPNDNQGSVLPLRRARQYLLERCAIERNVRRPAGARPRSGRVSDCHEATNHT
jgi:hypothetical protein